MSAATTHRFDLTDQTITCYLARPGRGSGAAAPLVLLHGGGVDRRMWGPQLSAYPERTVIAHDARGHGGSSDADGPHRLADDVVRLLDALEIDRAVLAGVSMGGGTAVDTALEHPDRVAGLVVSGTGTSEPQFSDPWTLSTLAEWNAAQERGDLEGWIDAFMRLGAGPGRTADDIAPGVWQLVETMARETVAEHLRVAPDGTPIPPFPATPVTRTWERLPTIDVPVLALSGGSDGADHRAMCARLAASVPIGDHQVIPGTGHYPNLEDPVAFDHAVREHLVRHGL